MALTLLGPQTPMLFMGQEFAASARFMFFADHHEELAALVHEGRREFLSQFRAYADEATQQLVPAPHDEATFVDSKLDLERSGAQHGSARIPSRPAAAARVRSGDLAPGRGADRRRHAVESTRSCCAGSTMSTAIACSWSTSIGSCRSRQPSEPLLAPPHGSDVATAVVERRSALRRPWRHDAGRRCRTRRMAICRRRARCCWSRRHVTASPRCAPPGGDQGRQIVLRWDRDRDPLELRRREWLITNGLGGYASGTIAGIPTRKYHGLFVPNLAAPKGRHIMISRCDESCHAGAARLHLGGAEFENERFVGESHQLPEGVPTRSSHRGVDLRARRARVREVHRDGAQPEHGVRAVPPAERRRA